MAYEAQVEMRVGDKNPLYGSAQADAGILTVQVGGTFTLYDAAGVAVAGLNGVPLTNNSPAGAEVEVWYNLDTAGLTPGAYYAVLTWDTIASVDTLTRTHQSDIEILLLPPVERPATYDITTGIGELRWWLNDKSSGAPPIAALYSDAELRDYLIMSTGKRTEADGIPILAAALVFEKAANDASKIASIKQIAIFRTDTRDIPKELRIAADRLRLLYASYGTTDPGDDLIDENGVALGVGVVSLTTERITRYNPKTEPFW